MTRTPLAPVAAGTGAQARRALRLLAVGGAISYRALFGWLSPWIFIPSMLAVPIFQVLLFAYIGKSAGVGDNEFYLIGNAVQYAAVPCLFAMENMIAGERLTQTLGLIITSPAPRLPLFLGRALPVVANGWVVSMFTLVAGGLVLDVSIGAPALLAIALVMVVASASCTGLGLVIGGIGLRVREGAVLNGLVFGALLIVSGANVPLASLPGWVSGVGRVVPFTHAIEACRALAAGGSLGDVSGSIGTEALIGGVYGLAGLLLIHSLERVSRRRATLETY